MFGTIHEECGVFGIYDRTGKHDVTASTYTALYALQHRGQQSCGIAVNDKGLLTMHKEIGLVRDVFTREALEKLGTGRMAIGHVRYGTSGASNVANAQPLLVRHVKGKMALAHNGALVNAAQLREELELGGAIFHTTNDTEVIAYMLTKARLEAPSIEAAVEQAMHAIKGSYSMVIMSPKKLIAARDPDGIRPLCMGMIGEEQVVFASETCALDIVGAHFVRDLKPGEIVVADANGVRSIETHCGKQGRLCVFEYVYFARPDSVVEGACVHSARRRAGAYLALNHPAQADVVIGVPDSGLDAALGFSQQSGIPYGVGFIKNRYVGRTFIQPSQGQREISVKLKLNALASTVRDKRVVLIDDSIVRGTTSAHIVHILREAGATEVHMRVSSPPFMHPCYFGTDIDSRDKLIACRLPLDEICKEIGADSLGYLSIEDVCRIAQGAQCGFCTGCFSGEYPMAVPDVSYKDKYETGLDD